MSSCSNAWAFVMLEAVKREVPEILNFCRLAYSDVSHLLYEDQLILSSEGSQQGDPLGPLLFCLALQPLINCLESDLVLGYLDDVSGGGDLLTVARDVSMVEEYGAALGLSLNRNKCELIALAPPAVLPKSLEGFRLVTPSDAELLGAPILDGTAMDRILEKKLNDLQRAADRMDLIASHDALVILRYSLGSTKLQYILRASPCADLILRCHASTPCSAGFWGASQIVIWVTSTGFRPVYRLDVGGWVSAAWICSHLQRF